LDTLEFLGRGESGPAGVDGFEF